MGNNISYENISKSNKIDINENNNIDNNNIIINNNNRININNNENRINNNERNEKKGITIGIDFGTSGLCFAYGYFHNEERIVSMGHFNDQGQDNKILNEIILDDELKTILSFGNECNSFLSTRHDFNFHHFKNIKMNLYKHLDKIKALNSEKEVDIAYIITLILSETKKKAIEQIKLTFPNLDVNDINYVITVPAIWDLKSKNIMFKASINAGLIGKNDDSSNFFALEPEAASIYLAHETDGKAIYKLIITDKNERNFILCDFGSGTVDIVTQRKKFENNEFKFEELYPPVGDYLGSNKINEYFIDRVIKPLFGEDNLNMIIKELYASEDYNYWVRFENSIEAFKKNFINMDQLDKTYEIDCEFFKILNLNIEEKISEFNLKYDDWKLSYSRFNNYKIKFPFKIIYDFMLELIGKIVELIIPITETVKDLDTMIFTGGATRSPIILKIFENSYLKDFHTIRSSKPEVAIGIGSVLFSMCQNIIKVRKAKYSFGIKCRRKWDDSKHKIGGKKIFDPLDNEYVCENLFSKFITKGDNLRVDEIIENTYFMAASRVVVELYKTEKDKVVFCDEKDENGQLKIWNIGSYIIDVGNDFDSSSKEMRKAIVKIKLGGTYISSETIYCKTNKKAYTECLFE